MFLAAYELYKEERYLKAALKCGEAIWYRGLVLCGNGLSHGITGNIYPFLQLAKCTGDQKWERRALQFTVLSFDKDLVSMVKKEPDSERIV